ncbi:L-fucose isomerase [Tessaracoccus lapidicaptus]|uniref:L-fucose isomerase n=1 Tax=Tessaracoccus lapidicaptus TaxID=1427523 RepID=A0A1C0AM38_9ACTN|nr:MULTISPECIES: L-fucose isomerase [Tessaracoccus]AQX15452.1 L-fucose isomerase [Tessaracoccus sp. T2.5-30]OCL33820.1 L-fucose isomerase [Tessaracoccus lapidicaptus]VEP39767.1 L-fucose isomerase [Tessaracoccus lapidicaptus]
MSNYPKIGIRPIIDGRRNGVRESLEDQTMNMALRVKELYEAELRYPDGSPVQVVIADSTIGRVPEAQAAAEKFKRENVGLTLSVTPCWAYGSETIDMDRTMPHAIWGFNGSERPGAVYLAAALAGHAQLGIPAFGIYGEEVRDADDDAIPDDVRQRLLDYATAGLAVAQLRGKSYLSIGGVSMGIAGCVVKEEFWNYWLGMRNEYVDMVELDRRVQLGIYDDEEYERAYAWVKENLAQGEDFNPEHWQADGDKHEDWWAYSTKLVLIGRDLMIGNPKLADKGFAEEALGHGALVSGFQGQRQWTDFLPNGDLMETMLNTQFDWNGTRAPLIMATENDNLNGASMLVNYLLTNRAQIFSDVRTYWSADAVERVTGYRPEGLAAGGFIDLRNSGATTLDGTLAAKDADGNACIKPWWELTDDDTAAMLEATTFHPANTGYFRGGGFSTHFRSSGEVPVTMTRINWIDGLGPVMQLAEGYTVELPDEVAKTIELRTDPGWPTTWFVPTLTGEGAFTSVYEVMNAWGANHGAITYGHIGHQLITLAAMLRIPVNMHNVSRDRIFRPKNWLGFGTADLEGADYRACAQFGPLYA